ncbi:hypothetical protein TNCV_3117641 [Trichonephila clavipes]|uniref:Uncharacterized protein n=1 Tax=Trichonephila clavipes TaxID=2585209 RepID=A0A8X7BHJ2_TRICX|nr:hypothetical protein TNCV_3117641 [Trichonephila clavipes]
MHYYGNQIVEKVSYSVAPQSPIGRLVWHVTGKRLPTPAVGLWCTQDSPCRRTDAEICRVHILPWTWKEMPNIKIDYNGLFEEERRLNGYLSFNKLEQSENQHAEIDKRWVKTLKTK